MTHQTTTIVVKPTILVEPNVDFYGHNGYGYEGFAGATPEEAVLEYFLQQGLSEGKAYDEVAKYEVRVNI